jgi:DNA-binding CsgD family transcriptional regulator
MEVNGMGASRTMRGRRDGDADGSLIDRIYEAAAVPELWRGVLIDFARMAGAKEAVLIAARGEEFNRWIVSSPAFNEIVQLHGELFPGNERTKRLVAARHAGFVTDHDLLSQAEIDKEPVYQEFLIPRGYGAGVATAIFAPSGDTMIVHAECSREQDRVSREAVARLDRLRPHFARAALLSARLEMERINAAAKALELIGLPGAVLGRSGKLLVANGLLAGMMPDIVQDRPSRLALTDRAADALLTASLGALDTAPHDVAVRSIPVAAHDGHPPVIVHVVPVKGAAHDIFTRAAAILVATPVIPKDVPTASVVQGLFDLTPAEAKLAALIAGGLAPRGAALQLGITEQTARSTLKRVLAKTGTNRQAELVGLLQGAAVGPPQGPRR